MWDLYICIFFTDILCIFAVLKNLSNFKCHKKCIEANPCQSPRKCEHYHWRCGKIIWGRIKSWRIPSEIPAPPVTCSIALILSQSDCPLMNLKCNINEERSVGSRFWTRTNCLRELQGVHQGTIVCGKYSVQIILWITTFTQNGYFWCCRLKTLGFKRAFSHRKFYTPPTTTISSALKITEIKQNLLVELNWRTNIRHPIQHS